MICDTPECGMETQRDIYVDGEYVAVCDRCWHIIRVAAGYVQNLADENDEDQNT